VYPNRVDGRLVVIGGLVVFSPLIEGGTTHFPVLIIRLILFAALTAWVVVSMKKGGMTVHPSPLFLAVAVFVGWAALSVLYSAYTAASLHWLVSILSYATLLWLVVHLVENADQVRKLVVVVLGMGVFEAAVGSYQFLWGGYSRAKGTFFNPNFFALYEMAAFALAFGLLCYGSLGTARRWERPALWVVSGATGLAFIMAQSRGALLAFVVAVGFVGLCRFGKIFIGALALCLLVGWVVPNPLQQRILSVGTQDPYAYSRQDIWKNSLQRLVDHPLGVGLGLYKYTSFQYRFPTQGGVSRFWKRAESAHSDLLQIAVELGVAGAMIFLVGVGLLGREIGDALVGRLEPRQKGIVIGLTGGILGILVHAGVDAVFHEPAIVLLLVLSAGLILVVKRLNAPAHALVLTVPFPYHPARVLLIGVLAVLLGVLSIRPAAAWFAFEKGGQELAAARIDRAVAWYEWAARIDFGTSAYHDALASAHVDRYRQSGEVRWLYEAVRELRIGLKLNPLDARLANRLGMLFLLLAQQSDAGEGRETFLEPAAVYYDLAIQLDPYSPFNYLKLGQLRQGQGRDEEALALFGRATEHEPNFLPARVHRAELLAKVGQHAMAMQEYDEIVKVLKRYQGVGVNALERQYLDVDLSRLKRELGVGTTS
jgi:Tfp pilus assembly protein PilF